MKSFRQFIQEADDDKLRFQSTSEPGYKELLKEFNAGPEWNHYKDKFDYARDRIKYHLRKAKEHENSPGDSEIKQKTINSHLDAVDHLKRGIKIGQVEEI